MARRLRRPRPGESPAIRQSEGRRILVAADLPLAAVARTTSGVSSERFAAPLSWVAIVVGLLLMALSAIALGTRSTAVAAAPTPPTRPPPTRPPPPPPKPPRPTTTIRRKPSTTAAPPAPTVPVVLVPGRAERVVAFARAQIGKPYRFAAAGPGAFDCSGLTMAAYRAVGIALPHYSVSQAAMGRPLHWRTEAIRPGDLVFMRGGEPVIDLGHVGIAVSATAWVVAPHAGVPVRLEPIPLRSVQRVRRFVEG
jgi:cell wall-associated NlpC family hydrolase